jgi:hypothetical protein
LSQEEEEEQEEQEEEEEEEDLPPRATLTVSSSVCDRIGNGF